MGFNILSLDSFQNVGKKPKTQKKTKKTSPPKTIFYLFKDDYIYICRSCPLRKLYVFL